MGKSHYVFHGKLFSGVGKGGYYVGHPEYKKRFLKVLGYEPFPGTLNLKLTSPSEVEQRRKLRSKEGVEIEQFSHKGQTFSALKCFNGAINQSCKVTLLLIEITHYDDSVLELISPNYLRGRLGLKDGDVLAVRLDIER